MHRRPKCFHSEGFQPYSGAKDSIEEMLKNPAHETYVGVYERGTNVWDIWVRKNVNYNRKEYGELALRKHRRKQEIEAGAANQVG